MLKLAANLTMLFTEVPFLDRFAAAAEAGFKEVEYLFPYDYEMDDIRKRLDDNGLKQVLFNIPCGDWAAGERGIASHPARVNEFRAGVKSAIDWALKLGVHQVNCLAGKRVDSVSDDEHRKTFIENIQYAADQLAEHNLLLLIEPINHFDIAGFFLNTSAQALDIVKDAGRGNILMQYDIYHAYRESEPVEDVLKQYIAKIGHIQIADSPGRHQPGTGEMDYKSILKLIDELGYKGRVAMEYVPDPDTLTSLEWVKNYGYSL